MLTVSAAPMPKAIWTKNGKPLNKDDADLDQAPDFCKLKLKKAKREDQGEYVLELQNESGVEKVPITLKVIGKDLVFLFIPVLSFIKNELIFI